MHDDQMSRRSHNQLIVGANSPSVLRLGKKWTNALADVDKQMGETKSFVEVLAIDDKRIALIGGHLDAETDSLPSNTIERLIRYSEAITGTLHQGRRSRSHLRKYGPVMTKLKV